MDSKTGTVVRAAGDDDVEALAGVLGRAFHDDPVTAWILPDAERRRRRLPAVYAMQLRGVFLPLGATDVAVRDGEIKAGALWSPPNRWKVPISAQLRMLPRALRLAGPGFGRLVAVTSAMERAHPDEPHWHLAEFGTDPDAQGTGLGRTLLESRLERFDSAGEAAYLESLDFNVPLYERFGFTVTREVKIKNGAVFSCMWRAPS
ncbi:GNAT family N-acetyltransferase [Spirillospora sp. CA-294931]|uniref:GNAT family N-acetyltransferase n=1 Tax=Spirillospora sp. CA-294931 TaxID=3240042 RepID=UPI003D941B43